MFGINDALRERSLRSGPIRVAVIGTGAMGGPMVQQVIMAPGMDVVLVIDVELDRATAALEAAGVDEPAATCTTVAEVVARDGRGPPGDLDRSEPRLVDTGRRRGGGGDR